MSSEDQKCSTAKVLVRFKGAAILKFFITFAIINRLSFLVKNVTIDSLLTSPPMTHTKSGVRTNGAHSLLKP